MNDKNRSSTGTSDQSKVHNLEMAVSAELLEELRRRVNGGEFRSVEEVVETALAYYFERHTSKAMAKYVDEELQAGLEGSV